MIKKTYVMPQMKAYQVKHASIICTSGSASQTSTQNEEYDTGSTNGWF